MGNFDQRDLADQFSPTELLAEPLVSDPMPLVKEWFDRAHIERVQPNPNAMSLATVDRSGRPQCRIVLCKGMSIERGWVMFYTNYQSRKGEAIDANPRAALVMHWDALDRQVRIEGAVERATAAESDAYYASRPIESRLGAWSSDQSRPIGSRAELLERVGETAARFGITPAMIERNEGQIERPAHWGGFRVWAERVELWVAGPGRVHDRAVWEREIVPFAGEMRCGPWHATRLQP
ncbi:pyridoxamine 5'-phosphate oxidase [Nodularia spumigena]|uniref:pyridoxamine 5'-phosphate oxidase n=1 Tax=Nodularia spumigena TaxID=70799 RepID=UPI002B21A6BD|nr:pyridoxamine 5'-phosphate oxidase [Nodularia spumigena]MEA5557665.1 pyridoxamine 5'-phosphate oxidase [Nodularia spumigena CH309]